MDVNLLEIMQNRRSIRKYTEDPIPEEKLTAILQAGLLSPSSRARRPWELIVVKDKSMLERLAECRAGSAHMLREAQAAIVVIADETCSDVWVEDCSIVMAHMHLMADSLGIGSCWIQGRLRQAPQGQSTEEYVRTCLGFPDHFRLEAILSLGLPACSPEKRGLDRLPTAKIHLEKF